MKGKTKANYNINKNLNKLQRKNLIQIPPQDPQDKIYNFKIIKRSIILHKIQISVIVLYNGATD